MTREIKFRAWNSTNEKMIDLRAITPLAIESALNCDGLFLPFEEDLILMQFTGLKDKNGNEIYEGDVVETENYDQLAIVTFKTTGYLAGAFCLKQKDGKFRNFSPDNIWSPSDEPRNWDEVIGNIYENPDLIEKTKC